MVNVMTAQKPDETVDPQRRQRARSLAIAWALGILVIIFYAATIVRLGPNAMNKDSFGASMGDPAATAAKKTQSDPACKDPAGC